MINIMKRREFFRRLGWGLAAGWALSRWGWPASAQAGVAPPRLALLADAHLPDGNARRPEARALARAVAEIRSLNPPPEVVLFAGDLAHNGHPRALALGKEILADLPGPLVLVKGEGDGMGKGAAAWSRLFGESRFSYVFTVPADPSFKSLLEPSVRDGNLASNLLPKTTFQVLGLDTFLSGSPQGPVFEVGGEQRRWLARELARLDSGIPLIILSHAPLVEIYRPWQQWTKDGPEVMRLLARFSQVFCFHGHVHQEAGSYPLSATSYDRQRITPMETPPPLVGRGWGEGDFFTPTLTLPHQEVGKKRGTRCRGISRYGLPATAWPLPSPLQGTLTAPRPGLGPRGCGWALVSLGNNSLQYQSQVWQA